MEEFMDKGPGQTQYHELSHTRIWITLLDQEWLIRYQRMPEDDNQEAPSCGCESRLEAKART